MVTKANESSYLLDIGRKEQLLLLHQVHALLGHVQMQRKLRSSVTPRLHHVHRSSYLFTLFLVLWQIGQHILHVVQARGSPSKTISPIHSTLQIYLQLTPRIQHSSR